MRSPLPLCRWEVLAALAIVAPASDPLTLALRLFSFRGDRDVQESYTAEGRARRRHGGWNLRLDTKEVAVSLMITYFTSSFPALQVKLVDITPLKTKEEGCDKEDSEK